VKVVIATLVIIASFIGAVAGSYVLTIHVQDVNNQKFCEYLETVIPRTQAPSNPAKNPSRELSYKFSLKTDKFEHSIGCRSNGQS
jgi:hypothetical protein